MIPKHIIKEARLEAELTQAQAAKKANISTYMWRMCEEGKRKIGVNEFTQFLIKTDLLEEYGGWL